MSVLMNCDEIPVIAFGEPQGIKEDPALLCRGRRFHDRRGFHDTGSHYPPQTRTVPVEEERYVQENIIEKVMVNTVEPLKRELETFIDCVDKNQPFPIAPGSGNTQPGVLRKSQCGYSNTGKFAGMNLIMALEA